MRRLALFLVLCASSATHTAASAPPEHLTPAVTAQTRAGLNNPEHIRCARSAARAFGVPLAAVLILLDVERGWSGAEQPNRNSAGDVVSHDLGPMQINDRAWLATFETLGITREQLKDNACINIHAGTWIYAKHLRAIRDEHSSRIASEPPEVEALLRYHSRTPDKQARYRGLIVAAVRRGMAAIGRE